MRALLQLRQIQEIERGDAGRDPIRRHAGELAARERELDEVQLRHDLEREARVGPRIERERRQIVPVVVQDLRRGDPAHHRCTALPSPSTSRATASSE